MKPPEVFLLFHPFTESGIFLSAMYIWMSWFPRAQEAKKEMWWFAIHVTFPLAITDLVFHSLFYFAGFNQWIARILLPIWVFSWVIHYFDDHDDRWKKRRKKLLSKVKIKAGKLVVIPVK